MLADALRQDYDVEVIGPSFAKLGSGVWAPLSTGSRVRIRSFAGDEFPQYFGTAKRVAKEIDGDVLYVSKPRLPGVELAILAKLKRNRPVLLDVDDYELGFFNNRTSLSLNDVKRCSREPSFLRPYGEIWTRYCESLVHLFDQITVSNRELQRKFGGMVLPHLRDERDFSPDASSRRQMRQLLGFNADHKVILFAGTPRRHKGYMRIADAVSNLESADYKFLLIGPPLREDSRALGKKVKNDQLRMLDWIPFSALPQYLRVADLICVLQDTRCIVSTYQLPAKFSDGLAMGIPMLASHAPVLEGLARKGLVELTDDASLENKIEEIFSNYDTYKSKAEQNRSVYLEEYCYGAYRHTMKEMIENSLSRPKPTPDEFRELIAYHSSLFCHRPPSLLSSVARALYARLGLAVRHPM